MTTIQVIHMSFLTDETIVQKVLWDRTFCLCMLQEPFCNSENYLPMFSFSVFLQIVGSRGSVEINPRDMMVKESSVVGVALYSATPVRVC